jgi:hypothetical protein
MCARVSACLILPWDSLKQKQKKCTIHALRELAPFARVVNGRFTPQLGACFCSLNHKEGCALTHLASIRITMASHRRPLLHTDT